MIVLDTHAWLWWATDERQLSRRARSALARADAIGVCTMSVFELVAIIESGRGRLRVPLRQWVNEALECDRVRELPLSAAVALDAAQLRFVGDPADRIIYATARAEDAQLVTRNARLRAFDPERTLW